MRCSTTAMPGQSAPMRSGRPTGRREIERRRQIMAALATQAPQPALNEPPAVITEPFTIMLWGITTDRIDAWLQAGNGAANGKPRTAGCSAGGGRAPDRAARRGMGPPGS